jgi:hypothetical protein
MAVTANEFAPPGMEESTVAREMQAKRQEDELEYRFMLQ